MKSSLIKASLFLNYFVFAILLNSVGAVILQVQRNYGVSETAASMLEGFKDLPIAIASFLLASLLPKVGLRRSMLMGLAMVAVGCFVMPYTDAFWYFKVLFAIIGVAFALIKVTVFATIGLITADSKSHSSFMSTLEGTFMIGVLLGNVLFSLFIDDADPLSQVWLQVYWILGGVSILAFVLLLIAELDEREAVVEARSVMADFGEMFKIMIMPVVLIFVISVFLFVLIEQSFQTWTPTFYQKILQMPARMSVQAGAVLAGAFAIGRFGAGFLLKRMDWFYVVSACIVGCAAMVLVSLPLSQEVAITERVSWWSAPLVVYIFPLMGIFLAPIYPAINSVILTSLPKHMHSSMSGLIVVFSALGGTTGSIITGYVFEHVDGQSAFYMSIIPMALLLASVYLFRRVRGGIAKLH